VFYLAREFYFARKTVDRLIIHYMTYNLTGLQITFDTHVEEVLTLSGEKCTSSTSTVLRWLNIIYYDTI